MNGNSLFSSLWKSTFLVSALIVAALMLSACQPTATDVLAGPEASAPAVTSVPTPTAAAAMAPVTEATLNVATDPTLGKFLVDGKGMSLYMFTKDKPDQSNCPGQCLKKWPPLLTLGNPQAGAGVDASLIGVITLADGSKMVTYNKMPLYYWVGDSKPGDVAGQDVGGAWYVVSPDGKVVNK